MNDFTTKQGFFLDSFSIDDKEIKKIDAFLLILQKSGLGTLVDECMKKENPQGREPYNPYDLFAVILYAFAFGKGTLTTKKEQSLYMFLNYKNLQNQQSDVL